MKEFILNVQLKGKQLAFELQEELDITTKELAQKQM